MDARSWKTIKLPKKLPRWKLHKGPAAKPAARPGDALGPVELCVQKHRRWLLVNAGGKRILSVPTGELGTMAGAATVDFGRHKGQRGISLASLLGRRNRAVAARIHACGKQPKLLPKAAGERWFLVPNKRGQLKLVHAPGPGVAAEKPFRPVVLVELVDRH